MFKNYLNRNKILKYNLKTLNRYKKLINNLKK